MTEPINEKQLITRPGNVHWLAAPQYDRGVAPSNLRADRMLLVLQRSPEQQAALSQLLREQHLKSSANFHKWLTPKEFGERFGPSEGDIAVVTNWLASHGFQINAVGAGRNLIEFSGTAGQVRETFGTEIHKYVVNGEEHWANASDPTLPAALAPVVGGIVSLHNFRTRSLSHKAGTGRWTQKGSPTPAITLSDGFSQFYGVGPADFATIYNVQPLWDTGYDGSGQSVAIVGRTNIDISDVRDFRNMFGLPENDPNIILNGPDPGIVDEGEQLEANLDVQWSGAVARNAKINFVVSGSTDVIDGIFLSAFYIIDNNLAPVMSLSFGSCELGQGSSFTQFIGYLWEQAAAQGITVLVSTGDDGSAACDYQGGQVEALWGLNVNALASSPYNIAVGGTDFDQNESNFGTYWNSESTPDTKLSVKSYIPETTWNEACIGGTPGCSIGSIWAGSGGRSQLWSKPDWQSGPGVPDDWARDLPDVSLFASGGSTTRSAYVVCQKYSWGGNSCADGYVNLVGGTSARSASIRRYYGAGQPVSNGKWRRTPAGECELHLLSTRSAGRSELQFYDNRARRQFVHFLRHAKGR